MTAQPLRLQLRALARQSAAALQLEVHPEARSLSPWLTLVVLAAHLAGLATVARLTRQPLWPGAFVVLLVLPLVISRITRTTRVLPETLTPLVVVYLLALLRLAIAAVARTATSQSLEVPEPWATGADLNVAMLVFGAWVLLAQLDGLARATGRALPWRLLLGPILVGLTLGWALFTYSSTRTSGVTASDPFGYVQMAVDLALHGTPLHAVRLTALAVSLDLPPWPLVPVGYGPPDAATQLAASAWPPGYSALLAVAYRLGGESALYWVTPLFGVATLAATWWLGLALLREDEDWRRRLAAGLAVLVLATSFEQVDHVLVPMADVPAQLFTVLAVTLAVRALRSRPVLYGTLSGLCLGLAFDIRYTQVLVAACLLVVWLGAVARGRLVSGLVATGVAAWVPVLPLLWYHAVAFGSPFSVESSELQLFAVENVWGTLLGILGDVLRPNEFLLLLPFGVLGALYLWWKARWQGFVLATWVLVLVTFHLPYAALRLRDLLPVFPALALVVGIGMTAAIDRAERSLRISRLLVPCLIVAALWVRTVPTLEATGVGVRYSGFGYLLPEQRAAFDTLARLTPADAIVAATLNSGPIMLYSSRDSVRPGAWATSDWLLFVASVLDHSGRIFLLDDGDELARPRDDLNAQYALEPRGQLFLPYFSVDAGSVNRDVTLYELVRRGTS